MKSTFLFAVILITAFTTYAQKLPVVYLAENVSLHFLSPEPIQYVDISTKGIAGDLPIKNVLRIKRVPDSLKAGHVLQAGGGAVITIAGERFIAQYQIVYTSNPDIQQQTQIEVLPEHMKPLEVQGQGLSQRQLRGYATQLVFKRRNRDIAHNKAYGIEGNVNHLATFGDYIFIDLVYSNNSNLKYDTDEIRFKIEDEKVNKASTVQSIEIKPEFVLFDQHSFRKNYHNVYVFKKFTFPGHKVLKIELSEKQLSGRIITIKLKYMELLEADTF